MDIMKEMMGAGHGLKASLKPDAVLLSVLAIAFPRSPRSVCGDNLTSDQQHQQTAG